MAETRTTVTFNSHAFNVSESRADFINPYNYGDDVARWLMRELQGRGFEVEAGPGQEDFGWYFTFQLGKDKFNFVIGYREDDEANWVGWVERPVGLLPYLLGARKKRVDPEAVRAIHTILAASPQIENIRWHFDGDFTVGREEEGRAEPF